MIADMNQLSDALNTHLQDHYRLQQALEVIRLQGVTLGNQITEIAALRENQRKLVNSIETAQDQLQSTAKQLTENFYFSRPY